MRSYDHDFDEQVGKASRHPASVEEPDAGFAADFAMGQPGVLGAAESAQLQRTNPDSIGQGRWANRLAAIDARTRSVVITSLQRQAGNDAAARVLGGGHGLANVQPRREPTTASGQPTLQRCSGAVVSRQSENPFPEAAETPAVPDEAVDQVVDGAGAEQQSGGKPKRSSATSKTEFKVETQTYELSGKTLEEVWKSLPTGTAHVEPYFYPGAVLDDKGKVKSAAPVIKLKIWVPTWEPEGKTAPDQKALIEKFIRLVTAHEAKHVEIYKKHLKDIHKKMLKKSAARAQKVFNDAICKAGKAQDKFDNAKGCVKPTTNYKDVKMTSLKACGHPPSDLASSHCTNKKP